MSARHTVEETRELIGADSLAYLDLTALEIATCPKGTYCTGCFDGRYPYDIEKAAKKGPYFRTGLRRPHAAPVHIFHIITSVYI